jgi:DNA gyrase subunit A
MARKSTPASPPTSGAPERIVDIDVSAEMQSSFLEYAYSVIYARALPDARDGLKPVQRRILFRMSDMGLRPDRGHVKSARVVGDVMGALHPHGDGAIYDALVRMAQPFSLRLPLIDGHGNFGSLDDGPAAHRYTECRLTVAALELTASLDEDVVDFSPNYDGREREPSVLPAAFPNLLVNGAAGIAVGMATNIAPHNLREVVSAARYLVDHPNATTKQLMARVPGPDFPCGAVIIGTEGITDAYETGRGSFKVRARYQIEQISARREGIVVTELPYNVGPERVIEKIKDAVDNKKLQGVSDIRDLSDADHGLRLVIEIKSGFNPQAVLTNLFKLTPMEETFAINAVALVDGQPQTLGLKQMLQVFLEHRYEVVRRRCEFRRRKAADRLHLVQGLLIAILDIDEVIAVIRSSEDAAEAKQRLITVFDLSEVQSSHILDMPLRRLTKMSRIELEKEQGELKTVIDELDLILASQERLHALVSTELAEVAARLGTDRRSSIFGAEEAVLDTAVPLEVADEPCTVVLTGSGRLARVTQSATISAKPGKHGAVIARIVTTARSDFGFVTSTGRVVRHSVMETPAITAAAADLSSAADVKTLLSLRSNEAVVGITALPVEGAGMVLITQQGTVKRVAPDVPSSANDWNVIRLDDGDRVVYAADLATDDEQIVFITDDAQLLTFSTSAVRPQGRPAAGMAGIKLAAGAKVIAAAAVPSASAKTARVITVTGSNDGLPGSFTGSAKSTLLSEYPSKGRATGGVRCHKFLKGEDHLALAAIVSSEPVATTASGVVVALPVAIDGKRDGSGATLQRTIAAIGDATSIAAL